LLDKTKIVKYHGWQIYQDYDKGYGPFFLNTVKQRINSKKATNVVVTGEIGDGKSYFCMDICRVLMGFDKKGEDRFKLSQIVFGYKGFMEQLLTLPMGHPLCYDEPSYSLSKRSWYDELQKSLVLTMESMRYKVHPIFFAITNKSLLDKTIRSHLLTFQVVVHGRGRGTVYRLHSSQFEDRIFHKYFCDLEYNMLDSDRCNRDSCLDCPKLLTCDLFRATYERKKDATQTARYQQAKNMAEKAETTELTMGQIEKLSLTLKEKFIKKKKIDCQLLRVCMADEYGVRLSNSKAYELRAMLMEHHPEILSF